MIRPATLATLAGLARMAAAVPRFLRPDPHAPAVDVRVVVPARNEEGAIAACVRAALAQATEVVVVDDGSGDATAERARAAGAAVVPLGEDLEAGWTGKPRACWAGAAGAVTEWLAFVDADVVLHPQALATMVAATRATSTSIVGGLRCRSFWERLLLPELGLVLTQEGFPPDFASGQCFMVRRDHYEAVGGHSHPEVRASVVDDRDLARVLTGHDARLAPRLLATAMYRERHDLRRGLVKNQAALHRRPLRHLAALLAPVATTRPWAAVVVSAGGRAIAGQNPVYGVLAPVARVALAGLYLQSWRATRGGGSYEWKGRRYQHGRTASTTRTTGTAPARAPRPLSGRVPATTG